MFIAGNGREALEVVASEKPDLILLDIVMDELTGVEVLRKLRESGNNVKVIMVTGVEGEEVVRETQNLGIAGYIHKPLVSEELERVVLKELKK